MIDPIDINWDGVTYDNLIQLLPSIKKDFKIIILDKWKQEILTELIEMGTNRLILNNWFPNIKMTSYKIEYMNIIRLIRSGYEISHDKMEFLDYDLYKYKDVDKVYEPDSFGLYLKYGDTKLYTSKRAIMDMKLFNDKIINIKLSIDKIKDIRDGKIVKISRRYGLGIIRYSKYKETGLYHQKKSKESYCGTFYYLEPDSNTLLLFDKYIIGHNKFEIAWRLLSQMIGYKVDGRVIYSLSNKMNKDNIIELAKQLVVFAKTLKDNYTYFKFNIVYDSVIEMLDEYIRYVNGERVFEFDIDYIGYDTGKTVPYISDFYAMEDDFDQIICQACETLGYDVIILTNMVTETRTVGEILDVRTRSHSFQSLVKFTVQLPKID